jgi:glycosyltransferase 2 family protein
MTVSAANRVGAFVLNFIAPQRKPNATGAIAQTVNSRLLTSKLFKSKLFSSRLGRSTISAAISLTVVAAASLVLYALLRDADFNKVVATLKAQSIGRIAIAGAFVIAGYITLTFYDYFALHAIGRHKVPYAIAALASFTSFTIGHSLGAAVLTGGLIRLRIYSVWGLTVLDIAKIAFITSMTFWLGNAFLLGGATAYAPQAAAAVDHLPLWINRAIGLTALFAMACYLFWIALRPRTIGRAGWRLALPNLRFTLVQICIGGLDLALISLAMYSLLPPNPPVGFVTLLVTFLTATLLGTVSHAPGGLGVIEVTMLVGLPQFQREELLAALLTFRALYFVLPLLLATFSLGVRELYFLARPAAADRDHGA